MSNISPPNFNNSNYDYPPYGGSTLRESRNGVDPSSMDGDPGNYGLDGYGDSIGGGQNSALQQYSYDRQLALQTLQNGNLDPQSRQVWQNYLNELDRWFQQYGAAAQSMGGMTGTDATGGMGDPMNGAGSDNPQLGEMIWQDQTRVKWDGSDPVVYNVSQNSDHRQQDFFQSDVTLKMPYHGSVAQTQLVADDSVPGAKMLQVTITMPDSSTRIINVHNVTDKSNIQLLSPDQGNIHLDASLTSDPLAAQVTVGDINSATTDSEPQGDQPTKRKDGKLGWDGKSFDIYSTMDGKDKYISARDKVHFHATSNSEYWSVFYDDTKKQYVVMVFDKPWDGTSAPKEQFYVDDMKDLNITFDVDPTHISFTSLAKKNPQDPNDTSTPDQSDPHGKKLSLDKGDGTPKATDDKNPKPDSVDDNTNTANYTKSASQDLTAYYDGEYKNIHISSGPGGTVTLHGASFADNVDITKNNDGTYTIVFTSGDDPNKKITYKVDGPPDKIKIDSVNSGHVKYNGQPYTTGVDPLITVTGEKAASPSATDWPGADVTGAVPSGGDGTNEALTLVGKMNTAFQSGKPEDWQSVKDYMSSMDTGTGDHLGWYANNIIRKVITAIYKAAGSDPSKFKTLMKLIPEDVRHKMKDRVQDASAEMGEKLEGDQWTSAGTAAQIDESFKPDKPGDKPKDD